MKPIDRDLMVRYPALPSYIMRLGDYSGITSTYLAKQGITASRDMLDSRVTGLALAYGYGKDTTRFLRDVATGKVVDFKAYTQGWETRQELRMGNGGRPAWRYTPGERMSGSDPFILSFKGKRFVMNKRAARRNLEAYGTSKYAVRSRFGLGNRKHKVYIEVPAGKLPARYKPKRSLRKPKSKRRTHRLGPNR